MSGDYGKKPVEQDRIRTRNDGEVQVEHLVLQRTGRLPPCTMHSDNGPHLCEQRSSRAKT